jgi:hypothetical protein
MGLHLWQTSLCQILQTIQMVWAQVSYLQVLHIGLHLWQTSLCQILQTIQMARAQVSYLRVLHMGLHLWQTSLCQIPRTIQMAGFHFLNRRLGLPLSLQSDLEFAKCRLLILLISNILSLLHLYLLCLLDTINLG